MTIYIPKKIRVGFQEREGCYTGKLAYVICYGKDGKIRKEKSWEGWRNKAIDPIEASNEPMDGFVLNKKAGDYSSRWGGRQAYARVHDPRGFEFEITIDNLLFILENCNSYPGKALEGQFVYAWEGKDLFLLPANCPDYQDMKAFSELKERKISPKKIKPGHEYLDKSNVKYIALGKCKWYKLYGEYEWRINPEGNVYYNTVTQEFNRETHNFIWESEAPNEDYLSLVERFSGSLHGSPCVEFIKEPYDYNKRDAYHWGYYFQKIKKVGNVFYVSKYNEAGHEDDERHKLWVEDGEIKHERIDTVTWKIVETKVDGWYQTYYRPDKVIDKDERQHIGPLVKELNTKLFIKSQNGEKTECQI